MSRTYDESEITSLWKSREQYLSFCQIQRIFADSFRQGQKIFLDVAIDIACDWDRKKGLCYYDIQLKQELRVYKEPNLKNEANYFGMTNNCSSFSKVDYFFRNYYVNSKLLKYIIDFL